MYAYKTRFPSVTLYAVSAVAFFLLASVGEYCEPLGLALFFALGSAGANVVVLALEYILSSILALRLSLSLTYLGQAFLLCSAFGLEQYLLRYKGKRTALPSFLALLPALALFVAFAPFQRYPLPFRLPFETLFQKLAFASVVFLCCAVFSVAVKALLFKALRCRLKDGEIVYCAFFFVLLGVGFCRFLGLNAYLGTAFLLILLFGAVTKSAFTMVSAFVLSLPPWLIFTFPMARFFVLGTAVYLTAKSGRLLSVLALLCVQLCYAYFDGVFWAGEYALTEMLLTALIPCLLFLFLPTALIRALENDLVFYREKQLPKIAVNRNRRDVGERLFAISAVFKEMQSAFNALNDGYAEQNAKKHLAVEVDRNLCKQCQAYPLCKSKNVGASIQKLVEVGANKGRLNLMDLPFALADVCVRQNELLETLNDGLTEYKRFLLEVENASAGRTLLANQALGISEILKSIALQQSEPLHTYGDKERALTLALLRAGIVTGETFVYRERDAFVLSIVVCGEPSVKDVANVASNVFGIPLIVSEKLALSHDRFTYVFKKRPTFDAVFGVASAKKEGESTSGDTHSVIKIDEKKFMVALCDGMGSGEYAHRISESAISLLESFYRADMPSSLVLSTVNKLLSFNREETFACVDLAVVHLDDGKVDVVKIGSPTGFILSDCSLKILEGSSLPLGILDSLRPSTSSYTLLDGDTLLFLSDGVTGAFPSTTDLYDFLKGVPIANPQTLVDALLDKAFSLYGGRAKDDMTAVAVRIFKR